MRESMLSMFCSLFLAIALMVGVVSLLPWEMQPVLLEQAEARPRLCCPFATSGLRVPGCSLHHPRMGSITILDDDTILDVKTMRIERGECHVNHPWQGIIFFFLFPSNDSSMGWHAW